MIGHRDEVYLSHIGGLMNRAIFVVLCMAMTACDSSKPTDVSTAVSGTYTLRTINGGALPATLPAFGGAGGQDIVTSGSFDARADHTWTMTLNATSSGRTTNQTRDCCYTGVWTQSGNTLSLQANPVNSWTGNSGTISGSTLIYTERGFVFVFQKT